MNGGSASIERFDPVSGPGLLDPVPKSDHDLPLEESDKYRAVETIIQDYEDEFRHHRLQSAIGKIATGKLWLSAKFGNKLADAVEGTSNLLSKISLGAVHPRLESFTPQILALATAIGGSIALRVAAGFDASHHATDLLAHGSGTGSHHDSVIHTNLAAKIAIDPGSRTRNSVQTASAHIQAGTAAHAEALSTHSTTVSDAYLKLPDGWDKMLSDAASAKKAGVLEVIAKSPDDFYYIVKTPHGWASDTPTVLRVMAQHSNGNRVSLGNVVVSSNGTSPGSNPNANSGGSAPPTNAHEVYSDTTGDTHTTITDTTIARHNITIEQSGSVVVVSQPLNLLTPNGRHDVSVNMTPNALTYDGSYWEMNQAARQHLRDVLLQHGINITVEKENGSDKFPDIEISTARANRVDLQLPKGFDILSVDDKTMKIKTPRDGVITINLPNKIPDIVNTRHGYDWGQVTNAIKQATQNLRDRLTSRRGSPIMTIEPAKESPPAPSTTPTTTPSPSPSPQTTSPSPSPTHPSGRPFVQ